MRHFRGLSLTIISTIAGCAFAAAPSMYYSSASGYYGKNLIEALSDIIEDHTQLSYSGVWTAYQTTDLDENGKVWDMYSTKRWTYKKEQCGSYSSIGDCYNREHSFPKSWFDDGYPMYTDLNHLYPTDGYVNNQRGNLPFGECANGSYVASSGSVKPLGRRGASTFSGYSGTVFEPDDEYKGDFARAYFYMATCYNDVNSRWKSDMLAGNSYPFFTTWVVNLLLKWHRQDPVSDKEIKRNDAVYDVQGNRNPFIDHPELAEHIWGDKKTERWTPGEQGAAINQPVDGSTVDFGVTALDVPVTISIPVRTTGATSAVNVAVSGNFTTAISSISADQANAGTTVKVKYEPKSLGKHSGTMTLTMGDVKSTVTLSGETVDGLPAMPATYVSSESFRANWTYIGDDMGGKYDLAVTDDNGPLPGYPCSVDAAKGYFDVKDLQPLTTYTYTLRSEMFTSNSVKVTTAAPEPFIDFLFDGNLYFTTSPGEPSEVAEILVQIENIESDITIGVGAPFELSLDRSAWSSSITISPDESRIYLRLNSDEAGAFESTLTARAGDYFNDNTTVSGVAGSAAGFFEDFETGGLPSPYATTTYEGTAAVWTIYNAGHDPKQDAGYESATALRLGKASTNTTGIEMTEAKRGGAGVVSFMAKKWSAGEADSKIAVETSTDGIAWREAGVANITDAEWQQYTVTANVAGDVRIRLRRTEGARMHLDDIAVSNYSAGVADPSAERHQWDAYCLDGKLVVTVTAASGVRLGIYTVAGLTVFDGLLGEGVHSFDLSAGQFVVVSSRDFTRTVLMR